MSEKKKMSKGEKIFWIVLNVLGVVSIAVVQLADIPSLNMPSIIGEIIAVALNAGRLSYMKLFSKKVA